MDVMDIPHSTGVLRVVATIFVSCTALCINSCLLPWGFHLLMSPASLLIVSPMGPLPVYIVSLIAPSHPALSESVLCLSRHKPGRANLLHLRTYIHASDISTTPTIRIRVLYVYNISTSTVTYVRCSTYRYGYTWYPRHSIAMQLCCYCSISICLC